jgi:S-formylglutathione hydrolase FrmB
VPHPGQYGMRTISFTSGRRILNQPMSEEAVVPESGGAGRPLLVMLHGHGGSPHSVVGNRLFAALQALGRKAPDVVALNGGDDSYYHDRGSGRWGTYIVDEAIPDALRITHADPHRIAITGISMGGFGALDIARLWPGRWCAVGGNSAAIFYPGYTAQGAFDDAEDFARHDLLDAAKHHPDLYRGVPVWIDTGTTDFFRKADTVFAHELEPGNSPVTFHVWPGGHGDSHWNGHYPDYIRFFANALAHCRA